MEELTLDDRDDVRTNLLDSYDRINAFGQIKETFIHSRQHKKAWEIFMEGVNGFPDDYIKDGYTKTYPY